MKETPFDPYYRWLGIPAAEQPADHYRLLGLTRFESDPDVIDAAAMRQMTHVRSYALGPHGELSQSLLSEIAKARLTLVDPHRKRQYDDKLRELNEQASTATPVSCPRCAASLTFSERSFGKQVQCGQCKTALQISSNGRQCSEVSRRETNPQPTQNASSDNHVDSSLPASAGTQANHSFRKRVAQNGTGPKRAASWLTAIVPWIGVCCACITIVILWLMFEKDPLGIKSDTEVAASSAMGVDEDGKPDAVALQNIPEPTSDGPDPAIAPFDAEQAKMQQEAWAEHLALDVEVTNSIGMKLRVIPPGKFMMGNKDFKFEKPVHEVTISKPFLVGAYEVTQAQYKAVMGTNPSNFRGEDHPMEMARSEDAVEFCRKLSLFAPEKSAGRVYRLPTEAEWEYVCRAGTTTKYSSGDDELQLRDYAWFSDNAGKQTHPVGSKLPNAWGIFDLHGNAPEWCQDWYGDYPAVGVTDPSGPESGAQRIARGGSWLNPPSYLRSTCRVRLVYGSRNSLFCGFRVVCSIAQSGRRLEGTAAQAATSPATRDQDQDDPGNFALSTDSNNSSQVPELAAARFNAVQAKAYQEAWARHLGVPRQSENSIGMKLRVIPPGTFTMGEGDDAHEVTLTQPFMLGACEVTQSQYESVMNANPSKFRGEAHPVEMVRWEDAVEFCRRLSELPREREAGRVYRLPTEAEWEYACRAGTATKFSSGNEKSTLGEYAWFGDNSGWKTHSVAGKLSNAWGLFDMHGNVWEWCQDWYGAYPDGAITDPVGARSSPARVTRGGCYGCRAEISDSSFRGRNLPTVRNDYLGFRVACVLSSKSAEQSSR